MRRVIHYTMPNVGINRSRMAQLFHNTIDIRIIHACRCFLLRQPREVSATSSTGTSSFAKVNVSDAIITVVTRFIVMTSLYIGPRRRIGDRQSLTTLVRTYSRFKKIALRNAQMVIKITDSLQRSVNVANDRASRVVVFKSRISFFFLSFILRRKRILRRTSFSPILYSR